MIDKIDYKIEILLKYRDAPSVIKSPELRASVCTLIEKAYFLEAVILSKRTFSEGIGNQFFTAKVAINRHFRDWGLDEVADIYNGLCEIADPYLI